MHLFNDRFISDVSVNTVNGNCYYASYRYADQRWETGYLNAEADYTDTPILGNKYLSIRRVKSLIRFDAQGEKIGEMEDFQDFIDIAIE